MVMQTIKSYHFTIIKNSCYGPCLTRVSTICNKRTTPICRFGKYFVLNKFVAHMNQMDVTSFWCCELCNLVESFVCWKKINFLLIVKLCVKLFYFLKKLFSSLIDYNDDRLHNYYINLFCMVYEMYITCNELLTFLPFLSGAT